MTSRQVGRRLGTLSASRRSGGHGPSRRDSAPPRHRAQGPASRQRRSEPLGPQEARRLAQLVVCGSIFVALVAAKLLLPARMAAFNEELSAALERNMDVQAVFSAVGRIFDGGVEERMEELYQAVFGPAEDGTKADGEAEANTSSPALELEENGAMESLRAYRKERSSPPKEDQGAEPDASSLAYVLYSEENLPEKVSLEQAVLGFEYGPPLSGTLTSPFGYREHPIEGEERFHYGVDLAAEEGTAIQCFAGGTVTAVGESSSYGRYCIVAHEGGYSTLYAHCSRVTAASGAAVSLGEKIAEVGHTGMATGSHLHFELHRDGMYLNPVYYVSAL